MEVILRIPDDVAQRLSATGGDVARQAQEALALEGYREQTLTHYQVSEMLGLSRIETEDFLGQHHVPGETFWPSYVEGGRVSRRRYSAKSSHAYWSRLNQAAHES